jgi:hypothetical protein
LVAFYRVLFFRISKHNCLATSKKLLFCGDITSYGLLVEAQKRPGDPYEKAEWLERQLREALDEHETDTSLWSDLLQAAFSRISWVEVAEKN